MPTIRQQLEEWMPVAPEQFDSFVKFVEGLVEEGRQEKIEEPVESWRRSEHIAMNIIHQIGDLLYETLPPEVAHEHFVKARQATNDRAIDFAEKLIEEHVSSQKQKLIEEVGGDEEEQRVRRDGKKWRPFLPKLYANTNLYESVRRNPY